MEAFLLLDETRPAPKKEEILIYTCVILVTGFVVFKVVCKTFSVEEKEISEEEYNRGYKELKDNNVSVFDVAFNNIANGVIYSPIAEELFFKIFLMKYALRKFEPEVRNVTQAVCFGLIHKGNSIYSNQTQQFTNIQALCSFINGFISGWVFIKCNSAVPCILAHMINNGIAGTAETIGYYNYLSSER